MQNRQSLGIQDNKSVLEKTRESIKRKTTELSKSALTAHRRPTQKQMQQLLLKRRATKREENKSLDSDRAKRLMDRSKTLKLNLSAMKSQKSAPALRSDQSMKNKSSSRQNYDGVKADQHLWKSKCQLLIENQKKQMQEVKKLREQLRLAQRQNDQVLTNINRVGHQVGMQEQISRILQPSTPQVQDLDATNTSGFNNIQEIKNALASDIQSIQQQNLIAEQQLLNQTSFLLSQHNGDQSMNLTRDILGNDASNISAIPAWANNVNRNANDVS